MGQWRIALGGGGAVGPLLGRVLVDAQVHPEVRLVNVEALLLGRHPGPQQALVDQRLHHVHDPGRLGPAAQRDHLLGGQHREAALEDRTLGQRRLLPGSQHVP